MRRRDFLKLSGASMVAPIALATKSKAGPTVSEVREFSKTCPDLQQEDWFDKELNRIRKDIAEGNIDYIAMSEQLLQEIKARTFPAPAYCKCPKEIKYNGIPVNESPILPIPCKDGDIHAIAVEKIKMCDWLVSGQQMVALETFPKGEYDLVGIKPVNPLRYYKL